MYKQKVAKKSTKTQKKKQVKKTAHKIAKRSFRATKQQKRQVVQWNKTMSPFDKQLGEDFVKMQNKLDGMWREVYAAPKEVSPIDFSHFDAKIKNKQALAQIKAEYEAKQFKVVKSDYQSKEAADALVKKAETEAALMLDVVSSFEQRIQAFKFASTVIPFLELEDEIALVPGLDQEYDRQLSNYMQVPDANVIKALDIDTTKMIADLDAGVLPEIPAEGMTKIMFTPVYFKLLETHQDFVNNVDKKYGIRLPSAETLINHSLKKQNALPTLEQINEHLETMELPFVLSAIQPAKPITESPYPQF
eukprot:UN01691